MEGTITRCSANYVPLSPIGFLERSSILYSDRISIVYGDHVRYTWKETFDRCIRLASALTQLSISHGDVVATLAPNVPATYELHFGVPMAGGVLCVLNTQYDSEMVSMLLRQLEAKIIFVDYELLDIARDALEILSKTGSKPPLLIIIPKEDGDDHQTNLKYESLLAMGNSEFEIIRPKDECEPITISYTSGTTGTPKGVVYSHRGAYLNSLAFLLLKEMGSMPVYLWTVPMFHCNGWCMAWSVAAQGGTNICLRSISAKGVFDCIAQYKVTHMGGAPAVLNMIANTPASDRKPLHCKVSVMTGGAPPPPQVLLKMEELGFVVTHLYGMTETYGVGAVCTWKPEWSSLPPDERAKMKARQGVHHLVMQEIDVKDPITMKSVPHDAKTTGEVMFRGNTVMNGYLKNLDATQEAFKGGWYRTGDVGVRHPDGYVEIKDRLNDIIVLEGGGGGKGENIVISTVEVECVLFSHPAVLEAAVVGSPLVDDDKSSKASCAFVKLKDGCNATTAEEIIKFCIDRLPDYMAPKAVIFLDDLPKTSTGKTQKYVLKERAAKAMGS